jgi:hypothetical protein
MPNNEPNWPPEVWSGINDAVQKEVAKVRIAQKVFPTTVYDNNPTETPDDTINFANLSIREGQTKSFAEIFQEFPLTATQVAKEADINTCKTLARMASKAIALAEDTIFFQGSRGVLPGNVEADGLDDTHDGLLGAASPNDADDQNIANVSIPINVDLLPAAARRRGLLYGENLFVAVTTGIAKLTRKAQAPPFALFLPTTAYADTFVPPGNESLVTTAERIKPLVEGGFYGMGTLPADRGLLVALGGDPTTLFVGREATTEFVRQDGSRYFYRVVERVQFVARDPRALVLLVLVQP